MIHGVGKKCAQRVDNRQHFEQFACAAQIQTRGAFRQHHEQQKTKTIQDQRKCGQPLLVKIRPPFTIHADHFEGRPVERNDVEADHQGKQRHEMKRQRPAHAPVALKPEGHRFQRHERKTPERLNFRLPIQPIQQQQAAEKTDGAQNGGGPGEAGQFQPP